jgi:hypothetical protein
MTLTMMVLLPKKIYPPFLGICLIISLVMYKERESLHKKEEAIRISKIE